MFHNVAFNCHRQLFTCRKSVFVQIRKPPNYAQSQQIFSLPAVIHTVIHLPSASSADATWVSHLRVSDLSSHLTSWWRCPCMQISRTAAVSTTLPSSPLPQSSLMKLWPLPDYWQTYIYDCIPLVKTLALSISFYSLQFLHMFHIFFLDPHN